MNRSAIQSRPSPAKTPAPETIRSRIQVWIWAVVLVLLTMTVYWPATRCDFVNLDDDLYVTMNVHVQNGLTLDNVKWAFCNPMASNWHPLTVLSHMSDCQMFGLNPWGHHLVNVLFHALNAALVFAFLRQMTGALWRSLMVAALFAVHPLHVESVAWIAERKDVLSGFFGLLTLIFYARYAQGQSPKMEIKTQKPEGRGSWSIFYLLSLCCFAFGLLSKPMLVTWPFVLLLLDYWPLARFKPGSAWRLVLEKIPFVGLAAVSSVVTFVVQQQAGAMTSVEVMPLGARTGNALISYCRYLEKIFWPTNLAVLYPHPGYWPLEQVLLAGVFLCGVSMLLFAARRRYPSLLMGWLWFVGTLVPVIGLVQVGEQAMADRYTYVPLLGILILTIWGAHALTRQWRYRVIALSVAGSVVIFFCIAATRQQLGYWRDSESLFRNTLAVTENNWLAHHHLGLDLVRKNQTDEAIIQYQETIRLNPDYHEGHNNLGVALDKKGQFDEAISQFQQAIRLKPEDAEAHYNLGTTLGKKDQNDEAIRQFQEAIRLKPEFTDAHNNLGLALIKNGQTDEGIRQFQQAVKLKPDSAEGLNNLAVALASKGRLDEAIGNYRKAIQIDSSHPEIFLHLGMTLGQLGRTREAIDQYREALKLNPDLNGALNNLAWVLATSPDAGLRDGAEAVRLAEHACELTQYHQPLLVGTLAAAYAESGRFPEAVTTAKKAEQLATRAGLSSVAAKNRQLLEFYQAGKPYHESSPKAPVSPASLPTPLPRTGP